MNALEMFVWWRIMVAVVAMASCDVNFMIFDFAFLGDP